MAVRRWQVHPDPMTGLVDRQELIGAIMDGESLLWRGGGVLSIIVGRAPTMLPGEMVTTGAVIEWKDRTDAKEQPERPADVLVAPLEEGPLPDSEPLPDDPEAQLPLDESDVEEDVSAIPAHAR